MAAAFAERECDVQELTESIEIVTGGTQPADSVHEEVVEVMQEKDIDLVTRTSREITHDDLQSCDYVIMIGCSAEGVCPTTWSLPRSSNRYLSWDIGQFTLCIARRLQQLRISVLENGFVALCKKWRLTERGTAHKA